MVPYYSELPKHDSPLYAYTFWHYWAIEAPFNDRYPSNLL